MPFQLEFMALARGAIPGSLVLVGSTYYHFCQFLSFVGIDSYIFAIKVFPVEVKHFSACSPAFLQLELSNVNFPHHWSLGGTSGKDYPPGKKTWARRDCLLHLPLGMTVVLQSSCTTNGQP